MWVWYGIAGGGGRAVCLLLLGRELVCIQCIREAYSHTWMMFLSGRLAMVTLTRSVKEKRLAPEDHRVHTCLLHQTISFPHGMMTWEARVGSRGNLSLLILDETAVWGAVA